MQGRNINLQEFILSRSCEIQNLHEILAKPYPNKTPGQSLPRTLRRRNMSHNRYRIPSRIRHKQPLQTQKRAYCRRHIRKANILEGLYKSREKSGYWLETHLYQTKRAKMDDYFGYKVAVKYNEKNLRASYRFCQNDAIIHDLSYYSLILLQGKNIQQLISCNIKENDLFGKKYLSGRFWKSCDFYIENKLVGIIQFLWKNENSLILIIHPGCCKQIYDHLVINNYQVLVEQIQNQMNIFQFQGPQSLFYLNQLFLSLNYQSEFTQIIEFIHNPNSFPRNSVYCGSFKYDKLQKIQQSPKGKNNQQQNLEDFFEENKKLQTIYQQLYTYKQQDIYDNVWKQLITQNINLKLKKFQTIQRARYSHKKIPPTQKIKKETDEKLKEIIQQETQIKIQPSILDFVIIMEQGNVGGFKLILKQGDANYIWRLLNYLNIKAIGLQEFKHINFEAQNLNFPDDYVNTMAYEKLAQINKQILQDKWNNKPPQKRVNYEKIASPFPFYSPFPQDKEIRCVKITMLGRGTPKKYSYICLPKKEDLIKINQQQNFESVLTENEEEIPSREIFGFITTGGYSFKQNKGYGIGSIFQYEKWMKDSFIVLIRKNTSRYYFAGYCELYQG